VANGVQRAGRLMAAGTRWRRLVLCIKLPFWLFPCLSDCGNVIGTCPRREKLPELRWSGSRYSGSSSGDTCFSGIAFGALSH
jgi:hypothetical protein